MYVFAKPKSLLLRASAVKATLDKFSEQGGGCHQALLRQQRPWTFILQRGHWDFDSLSLAHKGRKCSSVPSPQIIPASCELEKHVYFIFYLNLPWGGRKKKKTQHKKTTKQYHHHHMVCGGTTIILQNIFLTDFPLWLGLRLASLLKFMGYHHSHLEFFRLFGSIWDRWKNNFKCIPERLKYFTLRQTFLKGDINERTVWK